MQDPSAFPPPPFKLREKVLQKGLDPWPDALDSSCFEPVSASKEISAAQLQERAPGFQYEPGVDQQPPDVWG